MTSAVPQALGGAPETPVDETLETVRVGTGRFSPFDERSASSYHGQKIVPEARFAVSKFGGTLTRLSDEVTEETDERPSSALVVSGSGFACSRRFVSSAVHEAKNREQSLKLRSTRSSPAAGFERGLNEP